MQDIDFQVGDSMPFGYTIKIILTAAETEELKTIVKLIEAEISRREGEKDGKATKSP